MILELHIFVYHILYMHSRGLYPVCYLCYILYAPPLYVTHMLTSQVEGHILFIYLYI